MKIQNKGAVLVQIAPLFISQPCIQNQSIGRGFLLQRACLGYDANDLSLKLEGYRPGACGHGSCLVPVARTHGPV